MLTTDYIAYFRTIAVKNKKIQHNPAAESKDGPKGECAFTVFNMDQVTRNLRTMLKDGPCLHLHLYDNNLRDNGAMDYRGDYSAGYLVTRKVKPNNTEDENMAYAECEQVAYEVIAYMQRDYQQNGTCGPLGIVEPGKIKMTAAGPLWDGRFGWWVEFPVEKTVSEYISPAIADAAFDA